jgi:hypothetical protein
MFHATGGTLVFLEFLLGRFTEPRLAVLDTLRTSLRKHGYVPVLIDFEKPGT